jgi:hypothetical protein
MWPCILKGLFNAYSLEFNIISFVVFIYSQIPLLFLPLCAFSFGHCVVCPFDFRILITPLVSANVFFLLISQLYEYITIAYNSTFQNAKNHRFTRMWIKINRSVCVCFLNNKVPIRFWSGSDSVVLLVFHSMRNNSGICE